MQLYLVLGFIFFAASLMAFIVLWLLGRKSHPVTKRLKQVKNLLAQQDLQEALAKGLRPPAAPVKTKFKQKLEKAASRLSQLTPKHEHYYSKLKFSLMQAGFYNENSYRIFISIKILFAGIFSVVFVLIGLWLGRSLASVLMLGIIVNLAGYFLPDPLLQGKIRRRQSRIAGGLPDALDFLVICVEAGLGLNSAIILVGQEMQLRCKALSDELLLMNHELRTGMSREQSLRRLAERNPLEDLKLLVGSLVLADKLGTNIADTLRAQSDSLRTRVRQRAEEKAAKASLKMLFPLVFLIMPALFIVILGPGIILIVKTLGPIVR
jgi:tight adherence protein C